MFVDIFYFYRKISNILFNKLIKSNQTALHKDWEIKETGTKLIPFRNKVNIIEKTFLSRNFCQQKQAYQKHVYYMTLGYHTLVKIFNYTLMNIFHFTCYFHLVILIKITA